MEPIKVVIQGALGKMGHEVANAVCREADMKAVGAVDKNAAKGTAYSLPDGSEAIPLSDSL